MGGIVLCGGRSTRMGRPKADLAFAGESFLARVVRVLGECTAPVVVVAAEGQVLPDLPQAAGVVRDPALDRGPLMGLVAGLAAMPAEVEAVFLAGCDAPLLRAAFVRRVVERLEGFDAAAPEVDGQVHPLCAVYRTSLRPAAEALLAGGRGPFDLFRMTRSRALAGADLREVDPALWSLRNINTEEEYQALLSDAAATESQTLRTEHP